MTSLDDQVLVALRRIIRATDIHSRGLAKKTGLTTPQLVILRAVADADAPTVSEIARAVSLSQATVTTLLNKLESREFVTRIRSEEDRRRVNVKLTESGKALLKSAPLPLQDAFSEQFHDLDSWEQHMIVASLQRIANMMDAQMLDAAPLLAIEERVG